MYFLPNTLAFWLFSLTFVSVPHNQLNSDGCLGAALTLRGAQQPAPAVLQPQMQQTQIKQQQHLQYVNNKNNSNNAYGHVSTAAPSSSATPHNAFKMAKTPSPQSIPAAATADSATTATTATVIAVEAKTTTTATKRHIPPIGPYAIDNNKTINSKQQAKHFKSSSKHVVNAEQLAADFKENVAKLFANDAPTVSKLQPAGSNTGNSENVAAAVHSTERRHIVPEKLQYTKEISIKQGRLMGIVRNFHVATGLRDVDQYLGLPYAEAPVGSRRFMPPGTPLPWQGLKIARHLPPVCPQQLPDISMQASAKMSRGRYRYLTRLMPYLQHESEDCLYLNVYVPREAGSSRSSNGMERAQPPYPVMVYVHGESFEWNSGNPYDGSVLASYGEVIVVTINYRLGVMGFLKPSINEQTVANFGLLDQIAALHWIKENIASFGGNKDSVTLMGHTTGAACVNYLMISPVASGLFHRAILMSGSAMSDWAASNHSLQLTMQIAHGLNCPLNDDNEEMLSCLRQKRYQDILKIPTSLPQFSTSLGPIVDGHVIPNQPYKVMGQYTEHFSRYDLLFGVTESESYHTLDALALDEGLRENQRDNLLRFYMQTRYDVRPDLALAATLKKYQDMYNNPIKATNLEHRDVVLDILSDARVVGPLMQTGLFHADVNRRNFMYVFGHNSAAGPHASLPHSIAGEELAFIFGAPLAPAGPFSSTNYSAHEKLLSEAVMVYWTNFAKTGNPKAPWKGNFINLHALEWDRYDLDWPEFNKRSQAFMNIGIPPSIGFKYRHIYMNFWNKELPDELNQIASLQQQPFLHASSSYGSTQLPRGGTTPLTFPTRRHGSEVIAGHMSKFGTRDNGAEDPVRTLKLLLQEPYAYGMPMQVETAENMYNAPPTFGAAKHAEDELYGAHTMPTNAVLPSAAVNYGSVNGGVTAGSAIYGVSKSTQQSEENGGGGVIDNGVDAGGKDEVAKSETTIHLLIALIVVFILLNVVIYSTFLLQKKKKANSMQRKLGGILSYDGATDDDLKRSKQNDGDDSYILDIVRKSNTYEAVKTERSPINGFKMTRQLSSSTVDTHTKVCAWMTAAAQAGGVTPLQSNSQKASKQSSSPTFSSLRSSSAGGSFRKAAHKVNVAVDATPQARSGSVLEQEPIEVLKMKADGRNIIICQEVEVDDQELLAPQNSLDAGRYSLARQNSAATDGCEMELPQQYQLEAKHAHSHSDPVDMLYYSPLHAVDDERITSFMDDGCVDINVTSRDDDPAGVNCNLGNNLTPAQQLLLIKQRNYPKVLPTNNNGAEVTRATDSPPMTLDLRTTNKRNSLPPNSFLPYFGARQLPPQPPPRTISTLGRKPSLGGRRNSNNVTTSPLRLAEDFSVKEESPPLTQNTLIVGPIVPKLRASGSGSLDANHSTLKRNNNPSNELTTNNTDDQNKTDGRTSAGKTIIIGALNGLFQTFESRPASKPNVEEETRHTHHTEKVYAVAPTTTGATATTMTTDNLSATNLQTTTAKPDGGTADSAITPRVSDIYAQPMKLTSKEYTTAAKSGIPRIITTSAGVTATTSAVAPTISTLSTHANATAAPTTCQTSHVVPLIADNQISTSPRTAAAATGATSTRIPQLHRNLLTPQQQQQHEQQATSATDMTPATANTTTATTTAVDCPSHSVSTAKTTATIVPTEATATAKNAAESITFSQPKIGLRDSILSSASSSSTASRASNASTASSSASSTTSTISAVSTDATSETSTNSSSSTGTVRTELTRK